MGDLTTAARLTGLKAKLAAREDRPGFKRNARVLRGEIARLEAIQAYNQALFAAQSQEASYGLPKAK